MKNTWLQGQLDLMQSITKLQTELLPDLIQLPAEAWDSSNLDQASGEHLLKQAWVHLQKPQEHEVEAALQMTTDEELGEIFKLEDQEVEARKGLLLMQRVSEATQDKYTEMLERMRVFQAIRDFANDELQRRSRQRMLAAGGSEPLDEFTSRFMFGPPVGTYICKGDLQPRQRTFLRCRAKSGKEIFVEKIQFHFPTCFDEWIMKQEGYDEAYVKPQWAYSGMRPPREAEPKLARWYYKLGFKPANQVSGAYQCRPGYSGGFRFRLIRTFKTKEISPIE